MIIREFRKHMQEGGKSQATIRNYISALAEFKNYVRLPLRSVTYEDLDNYIWRLKENGLSKRTINAKLGRIKAFYRFLKKRENTSRQIDLILEKDYLKIKDRKRNIFSEHVINKLLEHDYRKEVKGAIVLAFCGAVTTREMEKIQRANVVKKDTYAKMKIFNPFNDRRRIIYIPNHYYKYIQELFDSHNSQWLFYNKNSDTHYSRESFSGWIKNTGYEVIGRNIILDDIKNSCPNYLYSQGLDLFTISEILDRSITSVINSISTDEFDKDKDIGKKLAE